MKSLTLQAYPTTDYNTVRGAATNDVQSAPWWLEDALAWERVHLDHAGMADRLDHARSADVVVVGGGYTGLWAAITLLEREPSMDIVVLEQAICGYGASGRNGGLVSGYWRYLPTLKDRFGYVSALEAAQLGSEAQMAIQRAVEQSGVDLWWRSQGHVQVAINAAQRQRALRIVQDFEMLGHSSEAMFLDADSFSPYAGMRKVSSGVHFREGATVHPGRLVRLLRSRAISLGASIYEWSPVTSITVNGVAAPSVATPHGRVSATEVIMATNAALARSKFIRRRTTAFSSHAVVSEPDSCLEDDYGHFASLGMFDFNLFPHYFQFTPDGRLLGGTGSGLMGRYGGMEKRLFRDEDALLRAENGVRTYFPNSSFVRHRGWGGPIDLSSDKLPFFGSLPGLPLHFAAGYSGHGVAPSWIGGKILASLALHRRDRWTESIFCKRRVPLLPPEPARTWGAQAITRAIVNGEESLLRGSDQRVSDLLVGSIPRLLRMPLGVR